MAESYIVKGNIMVTLKDDEGYIIRHKFYSDAYFCIDFNCKLVVATGARFYFELAHWQELQEVIQEGYKYMARFVLLKSTKFNTVKQSYIKNADEGCLFLNNKGELIFFLFRNNREAPILELNFLSQSVVTSYSIFNGVLYFFLVSANRCLYRTIARKTIPTKLVKFIDYIGTDFNSIELHQDGICIRKIQV